MAQAQARSIAAGQGRSADLEQSLAAARDRFARQNPLSGQQHLTARQSMPGGNTRTILFNAPFPLVIEEGRGSWLRDLDGHRYANFLGEYTAGLYGHSNPVIRAAIERALDTGLNLSAQTDHEAHFAAAVCKRFPSIDLVRFTNSGTFGACASFSRRPHFQPLFSRSRYQAQSVQAMV